MSEIWVNKANSFKEAEKFNKKYYLGMSRKDRLEAVQFLREGYYKMKGHKNESRKRLRRTVKIIQ